MGEFSGLIISVGAHRIELWTSFLSGKRSTTELRAQNINLSNDIVTVLLKILYLADIISV